MSEIRTASQNIANLSHWLSEIILLAEGPNGLEYFGKSVQDHKDYYFEQKSKKDPYNDDYELDTAIALASDIQEELADFIEDPSPEHYFELQKSLIEYRNFFERNG